jgi:alginate O-acetyltransferase complex protein AlgI
MILGGLWHGAAWNFVIWGAYHGLILVLYRAFERRPVHRDPWGGEYPYVIVILKMGIMFILTLVGWLIFRSTCVRQMIYMLTRVSLVPSAESMDFAFRLSFFALPLLLVQIYQYVKRDLLIPIKLPALSRVLVYGFFLTWILIFGVRESTEFIHFQF